MTLKSAEEDELAATVGDYDALNRSLRREGHRQVLDKPGSEDEMPLVGETRDR